MVLTIYVNNLNSLPKEIEILTELRILGLSANEFTVFPQEILQLKKLTELRLTANDLRTLPSEIGCLSELTILRLKNNGLSSIPAEIGNLHKLRKLYLSRNILSAIPSEIGKLKQLEYLDIRDNPIKSIPVELCQCDNIKNIILSNPERFNFPPSDVVELGTDAILRYLRAAALGEEVVREPKLLLVGEGAVGKTWLYKALNGRKSGGNRKGEGQMLVLKSAVRCSSSQRLWCFNAT
jgi:Leucine-rich repeat (LRR) protein